MSECGVDGCVRTTIARGYCQYHYNIWRFENVPGARAKYLRYKRLSGARYRAKNMLRERMRRKRYRASTSGREAILRGKTKYRNSGKAANTFRVWLETTKRGRSNARRRAVKLPASAPLSLVRSVELLRTLKKELKRELSRA